MSAITRTAAYGRVEALRLLRNAGFIGPAVVIPTVMYLVFTRLGDNAGKSDVAEYLMISMACFGAVGAALSNGLGAIEERESGWLQQLHATPLPAWACVAARGLLGVAASAPAIAAVFLAGALVDGVRLAPGQWAACAASALIGVAPFALLGVAIGYGARTQLAQQLSMLLNFGLALVGGLWIPADDFPKALQALSAWSPTSAYAAVARGLAGIAGLDGADVAKLVGWALLLLGLAIAACVRAVRVR